MNTVAAIALCCASAWGQKIIIREPESPQPSALMDRVRLKAQEYSDNLPNFVCEQVIRRFEGRKRNNRDKWRLEDTVTAEVILVDGEEDYRNARRNGKPVTWESVRETGTYSAGEYGRVMPTLMATAEFTAAGSEMIRTVQAEVYTYTVAKQRSRWRLEFSGQHTYPKHRGRVWIDRDALTILRIEMEALDLDPQFPISHAETTLDYGPVTIEDVVYLLPVRAAALACMTMENRCDKNEIEFRKHQRFGAESTITTTDSSVKFPRR
jgi:hypothetical protein